MSHLVRPPEAQTHTMPILAIVPTEGELDELLQAITRRGHTVALTTDARLPTHHVRSLQLAVTLGGLGKCQFAVQTQYQLDRDRWDLVVCAGAAGALVDDVEIGDVVVATETIEHDIRKVGRPLLPHFVGDEATLARCRTTLPALAACRVHFGGIASGDEDIVDSQRRLACQQATGALAVAWEGAGGARACVFSGVPFLEVRGIADKADHTGPRDFKINLRTAIENVSTVVTFVAGEAV